MSQLERRNIIIAKVLLAALMVFCFYALVIVETIDLSLQLIFINGILCAIFGYINLLTVKSELIELF